MPALINYYTLSLVLGGFVALVSGVVVYWANPKKLENIAWLLLSISTAVWSFGYFSMISVSTQKAAWISNWVLHGAAIFIPVLYFFFVIALTANYEKYRDKLILSTLAACILSVLNFTELFIDDVLPKFIFNYAPNAGSLYIYFTIFFFGMMAYSFVVLLRAIRKNVGLESRRLKWVFFSSLAGFAGGGSVFFLTFNINFPPYPILLFSLYPVIIVYAILKHHLFDIKVVATEIFSGLIMLIFLGDALLAQTFVEFLWKFGLFIGVVVFSILLIRSVLNEVRTREKLAEMAQSLKKVNVELKKADQTKSEFISIASHQLRTPLSVIKGFLSMLLEGFYGTVPTKIRDKLFKTLENNERLIRLVDELLDLSHAEKGEMKFIFKPVSLRKVMTDMAGDFERPANRKGLHFVCQTPPPDQPYMVKGDAGKLKEVISNLLDNAIKYTEKGSIEIGLKRLSNKRTALYVKDTGIGFSAKEKNRLFEKFARGKQGSYVWAGGIGLGLYVARLIMKAHGGSIYASSPGEGKGSKFWVEFPALKSS